MNTNPLRRVFLVDDHALIRAELSGFVEIIGEADEVPAAIEMIIERVPDVVLLDVHMPDGGGLAVLEGVVKANPNIKFLALSVSDAAEDVIAIIRAGARGYVTKNIEGPELVEAIIRTAGGDAVFSRRLAGFERSKCSDSLPGAIPTKKSPSSWTSPSKPWRVTFRPFFASSNCPTDIN